MTARRPLTREIRRPLARNPRRTVEHPIYERLTVVSGPSPSQVCGAYAFRQPWLGTDGDTVLDQRSGLGTTRPIGSRARDFNGTNQHITTSVNPTTNGSISLWFTTDDIVSSTILLGSQVSNQRTYISINNGNISGGIGSQNFNTIIGTTDLQIGQWYHGVITWQNSGDVKLYLNGQEEYSASMAGSVPSQAFFVGGNNNGGLLTNAFDGRLWDVRVYDSVLTSSQIMELFDDKYLALPSIAPSIHYRMEGNTDTIYNSGSGVNGTYVNSTASSLHIGNDVPGSSNDNIGYGGTLTDIVPANTAGTLDANGNAFTQTGVAPANISLSDSACFTADGTDDYIAVPSLVGTETVVSSGGTSTPSIAAGRINFTAGTCWDLLLSNGSRYPLISKTDTVYDVVNGNDGTITNGQASNWTTTQDVFHYGVRYGVDYVGDFDGADDVINVPDSNSLDLTTSLTIGMWVKTSLVQNRILLEKGFNNDNYHIHISGSGRIEFGTISGSTRLISTNPVTDNNWHFICGTFSTSNGMKLYIDGNLDTSNSQMLAITPNNESLAIGARTNGGFGSQGQLRDVNLLNKELNLSEVSSLMNNKLLVGPSLVGRWQLNQTTGTSILDSSSYSNNGTLSGDTGANFWKAIPVNEDGTSNVGRSTPSHPVTLGLNGPHTKLDLRPIKTQTGTASLPDKYTFGTTVDQVMKGIETDTQEARFTLQKGDGNAFYYGTSATNNPSTVSISSLTQVFYTGPGQQVSFNINPPSGHYIILLVNAGNDLTAITETNLNIDVTNAFTKTTNVRQIQLENYNSYTLGPSAGLADSDYRVTLG